MSLLLDYMLNLHVRRKLLGSCYKADETVPWYLMVDGLYACTAIVYHLLR